METRDFLQMLSEGTGVSGYEGRVAGAIKEVWGPYVDEQKVDNLGNLVALKRGEASGRGPKIMLAAHMDEIGLMVTKIEERGFLRFTQVGGVDQRTLLAQEVVVHGKRELPGVIGAKPPHLISPEEAKKSIPMDQLFVDVGLPKNEVAALVEVGDLITVRRPFTPLLGEFAAGKAMDDRAGVAVLYECLRELRRFHHQADVLAVATVQEEVGLKGAITSTYGLQPDLGIALDVGHGDVPGVPEQKTMTLDKGPGLAMGPNIHPKIYESLVKAAQELGISYQIEVAAGPTGTDAWAMQVSRAGVPTGLISIPLRYMHTSVETLSLGDVKKSGKLLAYFIAGVDETFVEGLKWN
ncbi:MAG: M42 family metallopeptidase [Firmicutes bacterium]|nr:M42 family metallopeptidase [Bacillota bacterium]MCL5040433.1 M42 family metallopeptidase [Bacillota bacterium]